MSLPKNIINRIKQIEKKIVSYPIENKISLYKAKYNDAINNRELVNVDKYGNRYYQQFSNEGIPTKRYVHLNFKHFNSWEDDPTMSAWLSYRIENPPTQEELERIYISTEELQRRGLEWDKKEEKIMMEYRIKNNKAIEEERKLTGSTGEGENYLPGRWKPEYNNTDIVNLTEEEKRISEIQNVLTELPKFDVDTYKNIHGLTGKYLVDFEKDDLEYQEKIAEKHSMFQKSILATVNKEDFKVDKLSKQYYDEIETKLNKNKEKIKELTELGKQMIAKKNKFRNYNNFKKSYKDLYEKIINV